MIPSWCKHAGFIHIHTLFSPTNLEILRLGLRPFIQTVGYHYCKLLSPARAMEWIYVDSLKDFFWQQFKWVSVYMSEELRSLILLAYCHPRNSQEQLWVSVFFKHRPPCVIFGRKFRTVSFCLVVLASAAGGVLWHKECQRDRGVRTLHFKEFLRKNPRLRLRTFQRILFCIERKRKTQRIPKGSFKWSWFGSEESWQSPCKSGSGPSKTWHKNELFWYWLDKKNAWRMQSAAIDSNVVPWTVLGRGSKKPSSPHSCLVRSHEGRSLWFLEWWIGR